MSKQFEVYLCEKCGNLLEIPFAGGIAGHKFLKAGDAPEAEFRGTSGPVTARAYCNLHGLWKAAS